LTLDRDIPRKLVSVVPYVRVIEVSPGNSNEGHAHLHLYLFSPYIHHELLRFHWGIALVKFGYDVPTRPTIEILEEENDENRRAELEKLLVTRRGKNGRLLSEVPWPVADIRKCRGDIANELVKYIVKDAERFDSEKLNLVDPEFYSRAYEGMEQFRMIATSRGFWVDDAYVCRCDKCGSTDLERRFMENSR